MTQKCRCHCFVLTKRHLPTLLLWYNLDQILGARMHVKRLPYLSWMLNLPVAVSPVGIFCHPYEICGMLCLISHLAKNNNVDLYIKKTTGKKRL